MTDYACEKPCKYCTVTDRCPRVSVIERLVIAEEIKTGHPRWNPNDGSEDARLKCGCTIPWPIIQQFGGCFHGQVFCSEHGYQPKITKAEIERLRKKNAKKAAAKEGQLPDEPEF